MVVSTNRNDIKPMFLGIAKMMMVFGGKKGTVEALQSSGGRHFAATDCGMNCPSSAFSIYVFQVRTLASSLAFRGARKAAEVFKTRFCFLVLALVLSVLRRFAIYIMASLALITKAVFGSWVLVELRKWFSFLAFTAVLLYDGLRHNQFLFNWLSFRAICGHESAGGSFIIWGHFKSFNNKKSIFLKGDEQ